MILNELQEIKIELLQDQWDRELINSWRKNAYHYTGYLIQNFMRRNNIDFEYLKNLKRVPRHSSHYHTRISRFVAAYIPKLSEALFNKNNSDDSILKYMKNLDTLMQPIDQKVSKKEKEELKKSAKEAMAEHVSFQLASKSLKESNLRRNKYKN